MLRKLKTVVIMMLCVILVLPLSTQTIQAKNVSKKSITVTLNENNPSKKYDFKFKKGAKVAVKVKVLSVSGKAEEKEICFAYIGTNEGKGSLFYDLKTSKLKKNKSFTSNELVYYPCEWGDVTFELPKGIESMKLKVTFTSTDGKEMIKSVKKA